MKPLGELFEKALSVAHHALVNAAGVQDAGLHVAGVLQEEPAHLDLKTAQIAGGAHPAEVDPERLGIVAAGRKAVQRRVLDRGEKGGAALLVAVGLSGPDRLVAGGFVELRDFAVGRRGLGHGLHERGDLRPRVPCRDDQGGQRRD